MIRADDHANRCSENCRARKSIVAAPRSITLPMRSRDKTRLKKGSRVLAEVRRLKQNMTLANVTAPAGRLIQKHHRQPMVSVKAPPINGPQSAPTPNSMPTPAKRTGRCASRTECVPTTKAPVRMPALPRPCIARPKIRTSEDGAMAPMRLPTSKVANAVKKEALVSKVM